MCSSDLDGVLIIGEHGEYPLNERGQRLYPRRQWFDAVADLVEETGRAVPVFIDKHLGVGWDDAEHIVRRAATLGMPLMAGSSVSTAPRSWRAPRVDLPLGARVRRAVVVSPPPLEAYGFHALEALQSVIERRARCWRKWDWRRRWTGIRRNYRAGCACAYHWRGRW